MKTLRVLLRQDDGSYQDNPAIVAFPDVPIDEIARFAAREGIRDEKRISTSSRNGCARLLPRIGDLNMESGIWNFVSRGNLSHSPDLTLAPRRAMMTKAL